MVLVAVSNVDTYLFSLRSDLSPWKCRNVPSGYTVLETKLWSSNLEASPSAGKNKRVVVVPCHTWKYSYSYFHWCGCSQRSLGVVLNGFSKKITNSYLQASYWPVFFFLLTTYLSDFNTFFNLMKWLCIISKARKLKSHSSHYQYFRFSF